MISLILHSLMFLFQAVRRTLVSNQLLKFLCQLMLMLPLIFIGPPLFAGTQPVPEKSVRAIVSGIVSYTRWPALSGQPRLCVFSSSRYVSVLTGTTADPQPYFPVLIHSEQEALTARCDAIYFGHESPSQQIALVGKYQPKPLLTIAEQNQDCTAGSAFCLIFDANEVRFSVNLDVLSRSGVRVNPDVLMLARTKKHE
ncbi:uncharacterized protein DUF4154 [Yokenella regensburgei]|uniref:Uncharacterized protein DUF4154 n=1 Tax=Yokenella regensburgei TaxID=158877 RepID=A0AB38FVM3_9ENTR|nr:YfiR family protein [Yokenella regensburgei ATCC 49455]RKR54177.1 uncharacterized protein DUF4154 [Yokenella regensburgei]SQA62678.1 Uncharacterised protein [Yokenella regensburgei]SQA96238.1 Uncharacterised protein [Yokenella regensburgei]SUQ04361.1 Uncharacterised protein [Yokenella regensburgei]